jgi:hypothetical protein
MSQRLHIPLHDLADYYEAGWILYGPSDTPGYVSVAWNRLRAPVVPFACVSDVMVRRDAYRLLGEAASKSGDGSLDPGRDVGRADDDRKDRHHESIEPPPRSRVRFGP